MKLSVIICTHNPRLDYLERALEALRHQTLPAADWELLLVDNASQPALAGRLDIVSGPKPRIVSEPELGQTPARLRGMSEAQTPLLVFVDDDNVLAPDYLEQALAISDRFPMLGAWSGQILPEFEVPPSPEVAHLLDALPLRKLEQERWSNYDASFCPYGAGLCFRREVARFYAEKAALDPFSKMLGRRRNSLVGGEDIDLALTSFKVGLGIGTFPELKLMHLIPAFRLDPDYLLSLNRAGLYSLALAGFFHGKFLGMSSSKTKRLIRSLLRTVGLLKKRSALQELSEVTWAQAEEDFWRWKAGKPLKYIDRFVRPAKKA